MKDKSKNKSTFVIVRVTAEEKASLIERANKSEIKFSSFLRKIMGLDKPKALGF